MPNRLAQESSPYLKQHANNPVDWYPWSEEALARAKAENKPILLSVGYSACHWCHVMEHESFENSEVARLMNENFINIKVDREERPDLDQIYQNVAQLMTRSGGWPLTVFLTPELEPFFGGTYFPPDDRHGRPGFARVLGALSTAYRDDPTAIAENARRLTDAIRKIETSRAEGHSRPDAASLRRIVDTLCSAVDWRHGGLTGAPKFPQTMNLALLWRFGAATGFGMAQEAAILSLSRMAEGGIYDQLGGGFHRYSVDETWSVPHFEKMLYDNALLMKLYAEVLLTAAPGALPAQTRALFTQTLAESTSYVLREMTQIPEGGFYSAQDADSEGLEGKFFVWSPEEIEVLLEPIEANAIRLRYDVTPEGNFEHSGKTVLHAARSLAEVAQTLGLEVSAIEKTIAKARAKLLAAREKRIKPSRDEKILASWNGLMISGLAWSARALRESGQGELGEQAIETAIVAFEFAQTHLVQGQDRLWSVYKDGKARFNAYLDDYAFLAMAALDLARVLEDHSEIETLLAQARRWTDVVRQRFTDPDGGFFFTSDDHEQLLQRPKTIYDQAIPSGNAVFIQCLLALAEITGDASYEREADEHLCKLYPTAEKSPFGTGELSCAALLAVMGPVVVSGENAARACFHPHVFQKPSATAEKALLVCHRKTCDLPYTNVDSARKAVMAKTVF